MLPVENRLTRAAEFTAVMRAGERARRGALVVYRRPHLGDGPVRVGLIVGKAVGGSVVRHRVSRRLRAQLSARLPRIEAGTGLVVRALPEAASADSAALGADLDRALQRLAP